MTNRTLKILLGLAVIYQIYMMVRCPNGEGYESLLGARALLQGQIPYRDYQMHIGPLPTLLFAGLMAIPPLAWVSFVFALFNFVTAWGIYRLSRSILACIIFLFGVTLFQGNAWYVETIMSMFGIWAFVFAMEKKRFPAVAMVLLSVSVKITGLLYLICLF